MATTVSAPLNAEPSIPEERTQQHLPQKSYVEAVEESPLPAHTSSGEETDNVKASKKSKRAKKKRGKKEAKKSNGVKEDQETLVDEKFDRAKGEALTSIKPSEEYEKILEQSRLEKREPQQSSNEANESLVSGRRAGAGWERSR
jgi:hypothetical protein